MRSESRSDEPNSSRGRAAGDLGFLRAAGEAGALIARLVPDDGPLGPPQEWSDALRAALGLVLPSRAQIVLFWGEDHVALYNDAFAPFIGSKHPRALGRPAREIWPEAWDTLGPMLDAVLRGGETLCGRENRLLLDRYGYLEEIFCDLSCSPVHEEGVIAGVLCIGAETTGRVLADRRLSALRALGLRLAASPSAEAACTVALASLAADNPKDLPWSRLLLHGEAGLVLVASEGQGTSWPVAEVEAVLVDSLPRELPGALALPLVSGGKPAGVLVAGLNSHQSLVGDYGSYLGLIAGQISLAIGRHRQRAEERRAEARLRESEALFRNMADHAPVIVWVSEVDGRCIYASPRWCGITGQAPEEVLGLGWLEAVHPEDRAAAGQAFACAAATGTAFQMEYRLRRADGQYAWMLSAAAPRRDPEGRLAGFIGSVLDISERRRAEEARELVARELSHRIKNIFMVTGGLAALTARGDPAAEAFAARLQARLRALSLAHDLGQSERMAGDAPPALLASATGGALTVHGLLLALLAPYADAGEPRVGVEGVDRPLGYAAANALALVLHEQATNAVKYGALSCPGGRLRIVTGVMEGTFHLDWRETGGPPLSGPPSHRGFGTVMAARSLAGQVRGSMTHDWRPEGLVVRLEVPEAALAR